MLHVAAALIALLGIAHSVLGERYILVRLFRRELPPLFGGTGFTRRTLRFAWHLTTVLFVALAAVLAQLAGPYSTAALAGTIGVALLLSGLLSLFISRGRHLSWLVLLTAAGLCLATAIG
ncbi:MAG: hypothetical protein J0H15_08630 [Xanthomonadales bacterium]|nr:hypothetical protein [Xanthomonadales bacterium]